MIPYTKSNNTFTFFAKGRQRSINEDHPNYDVILDAVFGNDEETAVSLIDVRTSIARWSYDKVVITDNDEVLFDGTPVPDYLAKRIMEHANVSPDLVVPLVTFTEKLMANPDAGIREDLFRWVEVGNMPIYSDGDFAAYKLVRDDFSPIHTGGKYGHDQSPGKIVEMPREACNPNRGETCSYGLHFCSYSYLPQFQQMTGYGEKRRVILLKINPADVVAIPNDYNDTKGRTCRFEVLQEISLETIKEDFGNKLVLDPTQPKNKVVETKTVVGSDKVIEFGLSKNDVLKKIDECNGNKSQAARALGINRSTLYRILNTAEPEKDPLRVYAEELVQRHGSQTAAALFEGVSRSTIARWLKK